MRRMFSEKQIKNIVADAPEQVVKALENQDVKVKTIEQSQPNWEFDIKDILNPLVFKDKSNLYAKMVLLNKELSIVISGSYVAQTESNTYKNFVANAALTIPEEIASKIYRADGTTINEAPSTTSGFAPNITEFTCVRQNPTVGNSNVIISSTFAKGLNIVVYGFGATTEDDECYIDLRVQLLII